MNRKIVQVKLDEHVVNLRVASGTEKSVRDAEALVNRRFQYFRDMYPNASSEQLWMYTAIKTAIVTQSQ